VNSDVLAKELDLLLVLHKFSFACFCNFSFKEIIHEIVSSKFCAPTHQEHLFSREEEAGQKLGSSNNKWWASINF
jgi:hypothetical protein